ncbi:UNVERIFIED_CONTAM: hypothetical protein GTU68_030264, partial [Idotea baltica]|nr:hypothetical protein [Idotea baltica]
SALDKIIEYKIDEVAELKKSGSLATYESLAALTAKVDAGRNALICEIKRKSPSAGDILMGANPENIACQYEAGGAACLSILTDNPSFGGSLDDFAAIRSEVSLPMLRKDFMIDPIQIAESRAAGADCILLILSVLDDTQCKELYAQSVELGMDVLIETHDEAELTRAVDLGAPLIGINNRDLKKMVTDLATTERLAPLVPEKFEVVSESGVSKIQDIERLRRVGATRFLIGESLMKRNDRVEYVQQLVLAGTD